MFSYVVLVLAVKNRGSLLMHVTNFMLFVCFAILNLLWEIQDQMASTWKSILRG